MKRLLYVGSSLHNHVCTPVCRLCGRYLAILGRLIRVTVPAVTVAPTAPGRLADKVVQPTTQSAEGVHT